MSFPGGPLSGYFQATETESLIVDEVLCDELLRGTRGLIAPYLKNTVFARGAVDLAFVRDVSTYTIFSRVDRGATPYRLSELASDLDNGIASELTIDAPTRSAIHSLLRVAERMPPRPMVVIVEDTSGSRYLILEGNKRCAAAALARDVLLPTLPAYVGHSQLNWEDILKNHGMIAAADEN